MRGLEKTTVSLTAKQLGIEMVLLLVLSCDCRYASGECMQEGQLSTVADWYDVLRQEIQPHALITFSYNVSYRISENLIKYPAIVLYTNDVSHYPDDVGKSPCR